MSNGEPKWYSDLMQKDAEEQKVSESSFAGIGDIPVGSIMQDDDKILKYSGDNEWALVSPTPMFNEKKEWVHMVPPAPIGGYEDCSEIYVNGKLYLMIDNSGPEEMNPHKLQEEIVALRAQYVELAHTLEDVRASLAERVPETSAIWKDLPIEYPMGTATNPVNTLKEAEKIIETNQETFGEITDSIVYGPYGENYEIRLLDCDSDSQKTDPAHNPPSFSEDFFNGFSGYGISAPMIDMSGWDKDAVWIGGVDESKAPSDINLTVTAFDLANIREYDGGVKLVSAEEADYERAMSMIGK